MCGGIGRHLVARERQDKATTGRGHISRRPLLIMSGANPDHIHKLPAIKRRANAIAKTKAIIVAKMIKIG